MTIKVTEEALRTLFVDEGVTDIDTLAEHFGVWPRTIERALVRLGLWKPDRSVRHLTQEEITRIRRLHDEGVPVSWIGEDMGLTDDRVRAIAGPTPDRYEFARAWQHIRRNPTLVTLHREFMPRPHGRGRAA